MDVGWLFVSLGIGAVLAALLLAVGHWFPWVQGVQGLPRMWAYAYGCASLWLGFTVWRLLCGDWITPAGLLAIAVVGGAVTQAAYVIDGWVLEMRKGRKAESVDDDLQV